MYISTNQTTTYFVDGLIEFYTSRPPSSVHLLRMHRRDCLMREYAKRSTHALLALVPCVATAMHMQNGWPRATTSMLAESAGTSQKMDRSRTGV
jgi:hypothetical protein